MTDHVARLYAVVAGLLVFFVAWAVVAAHPWQSTKAAAADPRLAALAARQQQLQAESARVKRILDRRWAAYRAALAKRNAAIAQANAAIARLAATPAPAQLASAAPSAPSFAPAVRVVTLPAQVITRTS